MASDSAPSSGHEYGLPARPSDALEQVAATVLDAALEVTEARAGVVVLAEPDCLLAARGAADPSARGPWRGEWTEAMRSGRTVHFRSFPASLLEDSPLAGTPVRDLLAVPVRAGLRVGQVTLAGSARGFDDDRIRTVERLTGLLSQALQSQSVRGELAFLRRVVDSIGEAVCLTDVDNNLLFVNEAFRRIYGYTDAELIGQPITLVTVDRPDVADPEVVRVATVDGGWRGERWNRRKDGSVFPILLNTAPVLDEQGNAVALVGVTADISEIKRAEQALRSSEQELRAVLGALQDAVFVTDRQGRMVRTASGASVLPGLGGLDAEGRRFTDLLPDPVSSRLRQTLERIQQSGEPVNLEFEAPDGGLSRWFEVRVSVAAEERLVWVVRDISERKLAEERLSLQNSILARISALGLELTSVPANANLFEFLGKKLKELSGAIGVSVGEYIPSERHVLVRHIETGSGLLAAARKVLGFDVREIVAPVAESVYREIVRERVGYRSTFSEVTFGAVPPLMSRLLQAAVGVDRFIGISYVYDDTLYGTSVLAFRKGTPLPPHSLLESFAWLAAVSLRRYQAEEALRFSEERYQAVFTRSLVGVFVHDLRVPGKMLDANQALLDMLGIRSHELSRWDPTRLLGLEQTQLAREAIAEVLRDGHSARPIQLCFSRPDGSTVWVEAEGSLLYRHGQPYAIHGIVRDVTPQRHAEESLRESEAAYRTLFEQSPLSLAVSDADGLLVDVNDRFCTLGGCTREEVLGRTALELGLIDPEDSRVLAAQLERDGHIEAYEVRIRRRDGRWINVALSTASIEYQGLPHWMTIGVDITDRKAAQEQQRRLEEQLQQAQKLESVGQLAGGVAHDFNNLLTVINGYAALLLQRAASDHPFRPGLTEIHQAGKRAAGLVGQLLAFSRKQVLRPRLLDLNQVVSGLRSMLARLIGEDIELVTVLAAGLGAVLADPHQLEQVLMNLAVNARDAMPGGGRLTIATAAFDYDPGSSRQIAGLKAGPHVQLSITDTGSGMDEHVRAHLFEPFFTTKGVGKGTGLGLSTVHGVVAQSGGAIEVESAPGAGTAFQIYLPVAGCAADEAGQTPEDQLPRGTETVLVVEDQAEVRRFAGEVLQSLGYTVIPASSGAEALLICELQRQPVHLVLTDVVMPGMSGQELVARIRARWTTVRVLFMSGYTRDKTLADGSSDQGLEFLSKPFSPPELARKVRQVLDR